MRIKKMQKMKKVTWAKHLTLAAKAKKLMISLSKWANLKTK